MTTSTQAPEYAQSILNQFMEIFIPSITKGLNFAWDIINTALIDNWQKILIIIIIMFAFACLKYLFTGQWGTLGSLLYNLFYFSIMYLIINNFGPEIILEDYFKTIMFLAYVAGFFLARIVLKAFNVKNMPQFHH